ncbi:MAG: hypothetical protein IT236_07620 [Bacteroidia bacterium]|nr:hypothetical protein [Bacteroidia bacterium]
MICFLGKAQETLQIRCHRLGGIKTISLMPGETLELKLKGQRHYRKMEITLLKDSSIFYGENGRIRLNQIKSIKLPRGRLYTTFATVFSYAGFGFVFLDTSNNLILQREGPLVNQKALTVSAYFLGAALLLKHLSVKRIRINQRHSLRIIDEEFFRFN